MNIYINGCSCISPQDTFLQESLLPEAIDHHTPYLVCKEPVYKEHINPTLARRLSRYIKMGVTTALTSLKDAGCEMPGAIITGTGLGSTEDNEKILLAMYENQERMINPTHFIQSTHNTISSQIAIMLKCHNYNNTYVHRGFSFESALLDGMLLIKEGKADTALVGGVDALTEGHYVNYDRIHRWRKNETGSLNSTRIPGKGVIPGEGSAHFLLGATAGANAYAIVQGLELIYKPRTPEEIMDACHRMLAKAGIAASDINLLITGNNGDEETDRYYRPFNSENFPSAACTHYKQLCGEYDTAGAFALWLGSTILKKQTIPHALINTPSTATLNKLLIYTHHRGDQHVLYLLSKT
jgi:3-oxoacyl-(acyl-carrier-protein) synthase